MHINIINNAAIVSKVVYGIWRGDSDLDVDRFYKEMMILPQGQLIYYFRSDQVDA
jgi:hypothetical protein